MTQDTEKEKGKKSMRIKLKAIAKNIKPPEASDAGHGYLSSSRSPKLWVSEGRSFAKYPNLRIN